MTFSDPARECAEAVSNGLNVLYELAHGSREQDGDGTAKAEWLDLLEGLAVALERTRTGVLVTDFLPSPDQVVAVRLIAALVADWLKSGQRPADVAREADALYVALTA